MAIVLGGGPLPGFGIPVWSDSYPLGLPQFEAWRVDMRITDADRAWKRAIGHYIRNEDEMLPPIGA